MCVCVCTPLSLHRERKLFSLSPFCAVVSRPLPSLPPLVRPDVFWGVKTGGKRGGEGELHTHVHTLVFLCWAVCRCRWRRDFSRAGTEPPSSPLSPPFFFFSENSFVAAPVRSLVCFVVCVLCVSCHSRKRKIKEKLREKNKHPSSDKPKSFVWRNFSFLIETTT